MTAPEQTRTELMNALAQLSRVRPEWRLGQTLANLAMTAGRLEPGGVWDLEDHEALAAARDLVAQYTHVNSAKDAESIRVAVSAPTRCGTVS